MMDYKDENKPMEQNASDNAKSVCDGEAEACQGVTESQSVSSDRGETGTYRTGEDFLADNGAKFNNAQVNNGSGYRNPYAGGAYQNGGGYNGNRNNGQVYYNRMQVNSGKVVYDNATYETAKKREKSKLITGIVFALAIVLAFVIGMSCSGYNYDSSSLYGQVMDKIRNNYLFDYDEEMLDYYATLGISTQLDAYSRILNPQEFYELVNATDSELYGISYAKRNGEWVVTNVLFDSPMDCAVSDNVEASERIVGLKVGDVLLSANGYNLSNKSQAEVAEILSADNILYLSIKRDRTYYKFDKIEKQLVNSRYVEYFFTDSNGIVYTNMRYYFEEDGVIYSNMAFTDGNCQLYDGVFTTDDLDKFPHYYNLGLDALDGTNGIGYIKLKEFSYTESEMQSMETKDFAEAMRIFKEVYNGKGKLILDLLGNPGGYNNYCLSVASYLTYNGKPNESLEIYRMVDKNGNALNVTQTKIRTKYADYFDVNAEAPQIAVLTDENSASASEMLTGAMLVYGTAIQIGTQTYGKGISQTVEPIKYVTIEVDGKQVTSAYAFYYTFAYFYTPYVENSTSKYNYYCNQSDVNGDGVIGEGEMKMGFEPESDNLAYGTNCVKTAVYRLK